MLGCCHFCKHHVQPGENASSIPWASQHPSKSRASIQRGERPLTHSARRESAGLGQELRPDTSAPSATLLPERMLFPQGKNGLGEEGTAGSFVWQELAVPASDREQFTAASTFPQDPLGRKSRVGWGCWMRGGDRRETPARQSCMCRMKEAVCREEALQALTESSPGPRLPDGP